MHCDIESALDKIVTAKRQIVEHQADIELRIGRGEASDRVAESQGGQRFRREYFQWALRHFLQPFKRSFFLFDFFDDLLAKLKMFRSGFSESDPPGRSREQPNAKMFFEISHVTRDQRPRKAQVLGGFGKTTQPE